MRPFLIAVLVAVLDQITKAIAVSQLTLGNPRVVLNNILSFSLVQNTGAAFGLLKEQTALFILISIIAIISIGFYLTRKKPILYLPLALILGGAVGNLIDRARLGYVIDFIDLHFWPVFNVADSCVTVGAFLLFLLIIRGKDASRTL